MNLRRWAIPMPTTASGFRRLTERFQAPLVVADQGLVSGASFFSTILLARFLGVEAFGRFTLVWMAVLFFNSLQFAANIQPMLSIGVKQAENERPGYYGAVISQQLMLSAVAFVALVLGLAVSALLFPDWGIGGLALPLGLAMCAGQTQDFLRRYLFVRYRPLAALTNDGIRYLGQAVLLYAVNERAGALSIAAVLWIMAATAMLATVHGVLCLERLVLSTEILRKTARRHWRLAKWLVPSTLMSWGTGHAYLLVAGAVLGAATVGLLRAAQTLFGVIDILLLALDNFAPARAAETFHRQGRRALHHYLRELAWKLGSIVLLLLLLINLNGTSITRLVYGSKYPTMNYLLLGFSITYLLPPFIKILRVWALAIEATEVEFIPWVLAAVFTMATAYPFIVFGRISGIFLGIFLVGVIWAAATFSKLLKR